MNGRSPSVARRRSQPCHAPGGRYGLRMGHDQDQARRESHWLAMGQQLAQTGRYRNVAEVEAALQAREAGAILPDNRMLRGLIDGACLRARRARGWAG